VLPFTVTENETVVSPGRGGCSNGTAEKPIDDIGRKKDIDIGMDKEPYPEEDDPEGSVVILESSGSTVELEDDNSGVVVVLAAVGAPELRLLAVSPCKMCAW